MSLPPGTRLGPYEITSQLGAGGMGEVYRARDSKIGRDVARYQITKERAHQPCWSRDGKELFYIPTAALQPSQGGLAAVNITTQAGFTFGNPVPVLSDRRGIQDGGPANLPTYDITADGRQFLSVVTPGQDRDSPLIQVVLNWFTELQQRVPTR